MLCVFDHSELLIQWQDISIMSCQQALYQTILIHLLQLREIIMIIRKDKEFTAVTSAGETIQINSFKRVRHEFDMETGFLEVEEDVRLLMDEFGRRVNCIEKGNYQIIDGENLIDAISNAISDTIASDPDAH